MRKILLNLLLICGLVSCHVSAQQLDTLLFQDFEVVPTTAHPVWNFLGPVLYTSGTSTAGAAPPNSPLGIGGSRAWVTTSNSTGLVLTFNNITVPTIYDSLRIRFNLAAMNLLGSTGGPDDLDYVLVAISTDGFGTFYNRLRIRGAIANNSFWPYSATGLAKVEYLPATEAVFQPSTSGLQSTFGYSTCEIVFPGQLVTDIQVRITARSSSSTDTWLIDNVVLTGEYCTNYINNTYALCPGDTIMNIFHQYPITQAGTYIDTIPGPGGCGSIATSVVTMLSTSTSSVSASFCPGDTYLLPNGDTVSAPGTYTSTFVAANGCDSIVTTTLSVNPSYNILNPVDICAGDSLILPGGSIVSTPGTYTDVLSTTLGCDSIITTVLSVNPTYLIVNPVEICFGDSLVLPGGGIATTSGTYTDVLSTTAGCDSSIGTILTVLPPIDTTVFNTGSGLLANAFANAYQWINCVTGQPVPGETNQNFQPQVNGVWAVQITVNNCTVTSSCTAFTVGNAEPRTTLLTASPNPTRDAVMLSGWDGIEVPAIRVFDLAGRQVKVTVAGDASGLKIGLQGLPAGIYQIEAVGVGQVRVVKHE